MEWKGDNIQMTTQPTPRNYSLWHLLWIIPLVMLITIILWEGLIVLPSERQHWDLTFACLEDLYNITISP